MTLPHGLHAGAQRYRVRVLEAQVDGLLENAARHFQEAADADPAQLACSFRGRAARRECRPLGISECLVEQSREVTAVANARYSGAKLSERTLVPGNNARLGETLFETWLTQPAAQIPSAPPQPTLAAVGSKG